MKAVLTWASDFCKEDSYIIVDVKSLKDLLAFSKKYGAALVIDPNVKPIYAKVADFSILVYDDYIE